MGKAAPTGELDPADGKQPEDRYSPGDEIAQKYELVERLGVGGMGEVWVAKNRALNSNVAIKMISADVAPTEATQEALGERLLQEARACAQLDHPAVVRIFDFGRTRLGDPMIVMELLDGEDLATAMDEHGNPSALRAVRTILPIAHGLDVVHANDVIHRDVKPENIFLCRDEAGQIQPKLVDFGIAKHEMPQSERITLAGSVIGSPDYMAPEQALGLEATSQSDIWALCVVLYELISGDIPFSDEDLHTQLSLIVEGKPAPLAGFDGAAELWPIVERGLAKEPGDRWGSVRDLGFALAEWAISAGAEDDITGASLRAKWFQTEASGAHVFASIMPPPPSTRRALTPASGVTRREKDAEPPRPAEPRDELEVLADLHRDGDPVEMMEKAARNRFIYFVVIAVVLCALAVLGMLMGTGLLTTDVK